MPAILIVEDEAKMRRLLELNLGEDGFSTFSAGDAETGLKLLREQSHRPGAHRSETPRHERAGVSANHQAAECSPSCGRDDRVRQRGNCGGSHESRRQRLRAETVFADRDADGHPQGTGCPQSAGRKPLFTRGVGEALCASQCRGPQSEDAGSAGHGRARRADECDRSARRGKRSGKRFDRPRHPRKIAQSVRALPQDQQHGDPREFAGKRIVRL